MGFWGFGVLGFWGFDIDIRHLGKIPGIIKILFTVLNSNEANIQKTILRIFNYLCVSSSSFQKKLLSEKPLLKRRSICLASGNKEVVQGSLMLLHDLAMPGKSLFLRFWRNVKIQVLIIYVHKMR